MCEEVTSSINWHLHSNGWMDGWITCRIESAVLQGHFEAFLFLSIAAHNQFSIIVISFWQDAPDFARSLVSFAPLDSKTLTYSLVYSGPASILSFNLISQKTYTYDLCSQGRGFPYFCVRSELSWEERPSVCCSLCMT